MLEIEIENSQIFADIITENHIKDLISAGIIEENVMIDEEAIINEIKNGQNKKPRQVQSN